MDFKIVREGKDVTIVRTPKTVKSVSLTPVRRVKVMCFDSERVDRIFRLQEAAVTIRKRQR